jgi:SAM-dependent methyltransferase
MQPTPWFENDAYWNATYPFMFPERSFTSAVSDVPKLMALSGCREGAVLDLCCGPGRHAIPLAQQGFSVTGVDRTSFLLNKAKTYAAEQQVGITLVQEDMRDFVKPGTFNLALSLFTSFGFFENMDENRTVLRNLHTSLTRGGVLVMEMMGKERLARIFQPTSSQSLPNGDLLFERRSIRDDWEIVENEWYIVSGGQIKTFHFRLWVFSGRELKDLLYGAGFSAVTIYGDLDGAAYGPDAQRLVAVARKLPGATT